MVHRSEKRKSKFQLRLEEVQKAHEEEMTRINEVSNVKPHTEDTTPPEEDARSSQTAQLPPLDWKDLKHQRPRYYDPINLWDGKYLYNDWYRVSDGDKDYYCNNKDNKILFPNDITHWAPPAGITYPPYQPMTRDDIKEFTQRDINEVLEALTRLIKRREGSNLPHIDYVAGVDDAIITLGKLFTTRRMTGGKKSKN